MDRLQGECQELQQSGGDRRDRTLWQVLAGTILPCHNEQVVGWQLFKGHLVGRLSEEVLVCSRATCKCIEPQVSQNHDSQNTEILFHKIPKSDLSCFLWIDKASHQHDPFLSIFWLVLKELLSFVFLPAFAIVKVQQHFLKIFSLNLLFWLSLSLFFPLSPTSLVSLLISFSKLHLSSYNTVRPTEQLFSSSDSTSPLWKLTLLLPLPSSASVLWKLPLTSSWSWRTSAPRRVATREQERGGGPVQWHTEAQETSSSGRAWEQPSTTWEEIANIYMFH